MPITPELPVSEAFEIIKRRFFYDVDEERYDRCPQNKIFLKLCADAGFSTPDGNAVRLPTEFRTRDDPGAHYTASISDIVKHLSRGNNRDAGYLGGTGHNTKGFHVRTDDYRRGRFGTASINFLDRKTFYHLMNVIEMTLLDKGVTPTLPPKEERSTQR